MCSCRTPRAQVYDIYSCDWVTAQEGSNRGKRREDAPVFEQCENLDNPLRCPVKLYEFYLSKW